MNVLLIGSGGREHAIALKISQSPKIKKLFIAPGNPGTARHGENVKLNVNNHLEVIEFCKNWKIDLVIVGPEQPLIEGIADSLTEENIKVFGPKKEAALIEGDKAFAKEIMIKAII